MSFYSLAYLMPILLLEIILLTGLAVLRCLNLAAKTIFIDICASIY